MFAVQRFDGSTGAGKDGSDNTGGLDRIALINKRKAARQVQGEAGTIQVIPTESTSIPSVIKEISSSVTTPAPIIHPSRLAVSQVLRQEDQKAKVYANGGVKEKTKAKQRYLKTKKERRKKRKAVNTRIVKSKNDGKIQPPEVTNAFLGDGSDESDEEEEEAEAVPEFKKQKVDETGAVSSSIKAPEERAKEDSNKAPEVESSSEPESVSSSSSNASEGDDDTKNEKESARSAEAEKEDVAAIQEEKPAGLSRFPAPKRTLQASRRDLAAQGLPIGLAFPHRIDPSVTKSIRMSDQVDLNQVSSTMKTRLAKMGITQWFAVQTSVISLLLSQPQSKSLYPKPPLPDLCVSAPTGSGKTLSYAVPIIEVLEGRICKQLRALIILPTRELVNQVRDTMIQLNKGGSLSIATITGQQSFSQEQAILINNMEAIRKVPGTMGNEDRMVEEDVDDVYVDQNSKVDILIATPGRLIDHLEHTPGFTLQHLRYLVIDEADRLLGQSFQEWLPRLLDSLDPKKDPKMKMMISKQHFQNMQGLAPAWLQEFKKDQQWSDYSKGVTISLQENEPVGVQKLLFSATLTRDPAKILALQLRNATFISVEDEESRDQDQWGSGKDGFIDRQESFALPATLGEHMIVSKAETKPLDFLYLLYSPDYHIRQALCFTKSIENAAKLVKLIEMFEHGKNEEETKDRIVAKEYSSDLNGAQRNRILQDFNLKKIDILICSDVMARGIDLPNVRHVISYDVPIDMAKYVHRVGRTARANRQGDAWTLVEEQEARHFKQMMKRGGRRSKLVKVKINGHQREHLQETYDKVISKM